ncbi:hypothetical protein H072_2248 [Dactylellina haptotyla CBS 200.50]|uniref:Plastocyanin-like domain-containing protein n=1 Tax=Dactylellina haptotyla (strain CBS 200.50) TaxID=1284197 RepID=S8BW82_DACHA|nr:hypothetical protein H072_2248 [Dactylellina haptotyla CBS 200.50]
MSWWKEAFLSFWLIVCQFFGFQSSDTSFKTNEVSITQAIDVTPISSFTSHDLYKGLPGLDPNNRISFTCLDDTFKKQVKALKPPEDRLTCNTPQTRQTWCQHNGAGQVPNICFDYETPVESGFKIGRPEIDGEEIPQRKEITVEITYGDIRPDGYLKKNAMLINGKYPGELIEAYWGQTIILTVINKLGTNPGEISNGTALHPHGLRLWRNSANDGVPGVTQCPIPPNGTYIYEWDVNQLTINYFNASSHLSLQYPNGVVAPMILHGPKSANYDIDIGAILLTDWYHENPFALYSAELKVPQIPNSTLINGKGKFDCSSVTEPGRCIEGSYWETTFEPEKWHLLRFVNTATASTFRVSIDRHNMTLITADFTAIRPSKPVQYFDIAVGQRYEVLLYANHTEGDFWLRSVPLNCNQGNNTIAKENVALGIIRYQGLSPGGDPTSTSHIADLDHYCRDMNVTKIVPTFARNGGTIEFANNYNSSKKFQVSLTKASNHSHPKLELGKQMPIKQDFEPFSTTGLEGNLWKIYGVPMEVNWTNPALRTLEDNRTATPDDFGQKYAVIEAKPGGGSGTKQIIFHINGTVIPDRPNGVMHPIHIHGHDFVVLAQGPGNFDEKNIPEKVSNPVRRDVATMPGDGFLIIAFPVDNPGMWLLHCHLAWHASQGLALLILERTSATSKLGTTSEDEINPMAMLNRGNCKRWENYLAEAKPPPNHMDDSGV